MPAGGVQLAGVIVPEVFTQYLSGGAEFAGCGTTCRRG